MFSLAELENVIPLVRASVPATPQYAWPLLKACTGVEVVVKHENHTPIGAFKVRGGIVYFDRLKHERPQVQGIVTATRGNHGQSLAFAGARASIAVTIVVPHGNSTEKNAAMRALGAELVEHGRDFDEAKEQAERIAAERGLEYAPSFHRDFVVGVATYAHELFTAFNDLDTVYVPIGLGSGICGVIGTRDALGCKTSVIGVVAEGANAYSRSVAAGRVVTTNSAHTFADGMAVRVPDGAALEVIRRGAERIVEVSDDEIAEAIRILYSATHNCAEGRSRVDARRPGRKHAAGCRIRLGMRGKVHFEVAMRRQHRRTWKKRFCRAQLRDENKSVNGVFHRPPHTGKLRRECKP
jgi:threonine dehydratase